MDVVLGTFLIMLGVLLWVTAGLLPVLKLRTRGHGTAEVALDLTWMGVLKLHQRVIGGVTGARTARDPEDPSQLHIEIATASGWSPLALPKVKQQLTPTQLCGIIDRYAKEGGPKTLPLPLRDRMSMMVSFALLFPLGTISLFAGALLAIKGLS